jgi:AAA domain
MATPEQREQPNRQNDEIQMRKAFPGKGLAIALFSIIGSLLLGLGSIWILSKQGIIPASWSHTLIPVFSLVGTAIGWIVNNIFNKDFFQEFNRWLFHHSEESKSEASDKGKTPDKPALPAIQQSSTIEQNPTLTFTPTIIIGGSATTDSQHHLILDADHKAVMPPQTTDFNRKQLTNDAVPDNVIKKVTEAQQVPLDPGTIFLFNELLDDPVEFYGRSRERETLISRTRRGSSTSIVGARRTGKTWLIRYLRLVALVRLGSDFQIGFVQATAPSCATLDGFISQALESLGITIFNSTNIGLDQLEQAVKNLKVRNLSPILCIDEFEGLSELHEFNLEFLENLRAITQAGLGLIVASKRPLVDIMIDIVGERARTSPIFNIFEQLTLNPFTLPEAEKFAQDKSTQAGFADQERRYLLEYGQKDGQQWPPLRLQLIGKMLLEDKNLATIENPYYYRPNDLSYWRDFEKRLEDKYQAVVRT